MSKCELTIELKDDPNRWRRGGDRVAGKVVVHALEDIKCNGLTINANWKTHGRGNISKGVGETETLFVGEWSAGHRAEYPFEVTLVDGPPTYHGHYINVDHYLTANVDVPWAFDPKESVPIPVHKGPTWTHEATMSTKVSSFFGWVVFGGLLVGILTVAGLAAGAIGFSIVAGIGGLFFAIWFVRRVLPKWQLGEVAIQWDGPAIAGKELAGRCVIDPKKRLSTGPITIKFRGKELATSGSGSNRRTHTHKLFTRHAKLAESIDLKPGLRTELPFTIPIDADVAPSFKLGDNELRYDCKFQIEIARWPDWRKTEDIVIVPITPSQHVASKGAHEHQISGNQTKTQTDRQPSSGASQPDGPYQDSRETPGISFGELSALLWKHRDSHEDRDRLVDATTGLRLALSAEIERRLLYSGDDPHVSPHDYAVWAHASTDPPLPLVLYVRHDQGDEFENVREWSGLGEILGWDRDHRRLRVRVVSALPNGGSAT